MKLSKLKPPKCTGCLFGVMTKLPWRGKESAFSHEIFVTTKPGVIVSVNQMESTEVGFFAQLKGSLTKKWYRYCTVFVDHFSRLHFVHLQIDDSTAGVLFYWVTPSVSLTYHTLSYIQLATHVTFYLNNFCISQGKKLSIYATLFFPHRNSRIYGKTTHIKHPETPSPCWCHVMLQRHGYGESANTLTEASSEEGGGQTKKKIN
jgi:hypothetical protein